MTQKRYFDAIEEAINQVELEKNISGETPEQSDSIANEPQRRKLKLLMIGTPEVVQSAIYHFHLTGHSEVGDWSRFLPSPSDPEEVMSILVRKVTVQ